ncbi:Protein LURP-one-related 15 [Hibiscus syriacus]|uniref:Protein LURP-one-related 15 n=1 Tax=Hibiscus syriacus TaxID=106335 RepID=A0A6A2X1K7_HIBSY|nr:protein LURP-one-related 10-like [Hibiscus syriacus]KAE8668653.1 Protein LURP-one-related 15 [Hibiscus syriacus]
MEHVQGPPPPAAPSAYFPMAHPVSVIGPQYCYPQPVDLAVVRKVLAITEGNFAVTDMNGNIMFKIKGKFLSIHDRRILTDAAGNPICTLRPKIMTVHDRWQVFRGESTEDKDLIFTVKRSSMIQFKTKLHVFLASNPKEDVSDFRVEGSWLERSCTVYSGESNTILAQMHKKHSVQSVLLGKDKFMVTVYPNVDYAFVVALIAILDGINKDDDDIVE